MQPSRGVVKVAVEIEVPAWNNGRTYQQICAELVERGYMLGNKDTWQASHQYGCRCEEGGCGLVRRGDVIIPPLVSLTYDGSLPRLGGEFVTSPVVLVDNGEEALKEIWDIVTANAQWTMKLKNYHENGSCSPSIHVHCSVTTEEHDREIVPARGDFMRDDVMTALALFSPEFLLLADYDPERRRGLEFRMPLRFSAGREGHHGFVHIRNSLPGFMYIEWRMFEALYDSWDYIRGSLYLSAAMTRALLKPGTISLMMAEGFGRPYEDKVLAEAVREDDTEKVLKLVHPGRLEFLGGLLLNELDDDINGYHAVDHLLKGALARVR